MKKKIKFPLEMKDGIQVRTLEDLRENFDLEKACEAFASGKLLTWLEERYYEEEAEQLEALEQSDVNLKKKLCQILGVEWTGEDSVDLDEIALRQEKLAKLKQLTDDEEILSKVNQVAFDQEDLADLLDEGIEEVILCDNKFVIPLRVKNIHYRGIGKVTAEIKSSKDVSLDELGIILENAEIVCPNSVKVLAEKSRDVVGESINTTPKDEDYDVYVKSVPCFYFWKDGKYFASLEPVEGSKETTPGMVAIYCRNKINGQERLVDVICPIIEHYSNSDHSVKGYSFCYEDEAEALELLLEKFQKSFKVHNGFIYYLKASEDMDNMYYPSSNQYISADEEQGLFKQALTGGEAVRLVSKQKFISMMRKLSNHNSIGCLMGSPNCFYGAAENKIIFSVGGVDAGYMRLRGREFRCLWKYDESKNEINLLDSMESRSGFRCIYSDDESFIYNGNEKIKQYFIKKGYSKEITGKCLAAYSGRDKELFSAVVLKNGIYYVKDSKDNGVYRYDINSGKEELVIKIGRVCFEGFYIEDDILYTANSDLSYGYTHNPLNSPIEITMKETKRREECSKKLSSNFNNLAEHKIPDFINTGRAMTVSDSNNSIEPKIPDFIRRKKEFF